MIWVDWQNNYNCLNLKILYKFQCTICDNTRTSAPSTIKKSLCGSCRSDNEYGRIIIGQFFGFWQVQKIINKSTLICLCTGCNNTIKKVVKTPVNMTEHEHALQDGLSRVYDCGKIRYKLTMDML